MTSQVNWALLGLIIERPGYGSQLQQRLEHAYGGALPTRSETHVYTALDALEERGYIESFSADAAPTAPRKTGRQPKVRYRATAVGKQAYRDWVLALLVEDRRHSRIFIRQLAVFARADPKVGLEIVECYAEAYAREAKRTTSTEISRGDLVGGLATRLQAEDDRLSMQGKLQWSDYARAEFEALVKRVLDGPAGA